MTNDQIHPIDRLIGQRMTEARAATRMTQAQLASALGVTFQQVQKYERGTNRVAASRLHDAAIALGVDISYFFAGTPAVDAEADRPVIRRMARLLEPMTDVEVTAFADFAQTLQGRKTA